MILRLGTFDDVRGEEEPGIAGKPISRGDTCALAAVVFSGCEDTSTGIRYLRYVCIPYVCTFHVEVRMPSMYVYGKN